MARRRDGDGEESPPRPPECGDSRKPSGHAGQEPQRDPRQIGRTICGEWPPVGCVRARMGTHRFRRSQLADEREGRFEFVLFMVALRHSLTKQSRCIYIARGGVGRGEPNPEQPCHAS